MYKLTRFLSIFLFGIFSVGMVAADVRVEGWARATPPGSSTGAIYGEFTNTGDTTRTVTRIEFDGAHHVMVHRTSHSEDMARMQESLLQIPAGESVTLAPGGLHIMLMGLTEGLKEGCNYTIHLKWDDGTRSTHKFKTGGFGQMVAPDDDVEKAECQ